MEPTLFGFVWRYSRTQQLMILALTIVTFPFVYASLEIPKIIINKAINGSDFPKVILGVELEQTVYLLLLCVVFLSLIVIINALKWLMNVAIGMTGERMLRRLRHMLYERVLRFRMSQFRTSRPGEIIQSILGEIEPLGGFIGEIVATPVFQGGLLCVYITFIFVQDPWLGFAAVSLYPVQAVLIPRLQAKIIKLNKQRAANTREIADRIGESVGNIADIHVNDTGRSHLARLSAQLHENTMIRRALFERKFTIKFINNFLNQLTPFFFFSVGGYLVIQGRLDFGSLVAVLAAYKDVAAPWKALLNFSQRWTDFNGRYTFVIENFVAADTHDERRLFDRDARPLEGPLALREVAGGPGTGGLTVQRLDIPPGTTVAVTGGASGAREAVLRMMAGLAMPASGEVTIGGQPLGEATLPQIGAALAYVGSEPGVFFGTVRENLVYGLMRNGPDLSDSNRPEAAPLLHEARATGSTTADAAGDWTDYAAAGVADGAALEARVIALVERFGLADDIVSAALGSRIPPAEETRWSGPVLAARRRFAETAPDLAELVEPWQADRYNKNGTVLANILFALPPASEEDFEAQLREPSVRRLLEECGGGDLLTEIGLDIAGEFRTLVETVGPESPVLNRYSVYGRQEILESAAIHARVQQRGIARLEGRLAGRLQAVAARFVAVRDQLDVLDEGRRARILEARAKARGPVRELPDLVAFDEDRFSPARTVAENILHARRRFDRRAGWKRLDEAVERVIAAEGLGPELIGLGLGRPIGEAGLSGAAQRRLALVRAILKRPRVLILDGIAGGDGPADTALCAAIRAELPEGTIVYAAAGEFAAGAADLHTHIREDGRLEIVGRETA